MVLVAQTLQVKWHVLSAVGQMTEILRPNGPGDYTNLYEQYPADGAHWDKVDEVSADSTTYVVCLGQTQTKDAYNLQDTSISGVPINSIRVYFSFRCGLTGRTDWAQPFLRLGGNETAGTERAKTDNSYTTFSEVLARPGGGDWVVGDLNSLQVALGLRVGTNGNARFTQIYVEVSYTLPPVPVSNTLQVMWNVLALVPPILVSQSVQFVFNVLALVGGSPRFPRAPLTIESTISSGLEITSTIGSG